MAMYDQNCFVLSHVATLLHTYLKFIKFKLASSANNGLIRIPRASENIQIIEWFHSEELRVARYVRIYWLRLWARYV